MNLVTVKYNYELDLASNHILLKGQLHKIIKGTGFCEEIRCSSFSSKGEIESGYDSTPMKFNITIQDKLINLNNRYINFKFYNLLGEWAARVNSVNVKENITTLEGFLLELITFEPVFVSTKQNNLRVEKLQNRFISIY